MTKDEGCLALPPRKTIEQEYEVHGPRFTELLRAARAASAGIDIDYFRALATPQVIAHLMGELIAEKGYSRYYEQKFHAVSAECADLASRGWGRVGDFAPLNERAR